MAGTTGRIFISYRRQETAWPARQLYDVLVARFGAASVFKDVDDIEPGEDFVDKITEAVAACDVLLALIGPQWLTMTDVKGQRRLDNPEDFVRLELRAALERGVRVVPILVDGARMPDAAQLPADLAAITRRQAVEINPVGFNTDRLLATLANVFASTAEPPPAPGPARGDVTRTEVTPAELTRTAAPRSASGRRLILAAAAAVVLALTGVLIWRPWVGAVATGTPSDRPSPSGSGTPSTSPSTSPSLVAAHLPDPPVVAHRGGLEEHQFETQQAMEAAARAGFAVETDVRYTKDGVAVLVHDEAATKGLDCGGKDIRVSRTTWSELRATCRSKPTATDPKRYQVPTLDATLEAIAAASPTAWVFLEVKTDLSAAQRRAFLAAPAKYGLSDRTVVTSFERDRLRAVRDADPSARRMLFVSGSRVPADDLRGDRLWGVAVEQGIATAGYVEQLKALGVKVMVWVVNDPRQWATVVELSPDLLMTAYPAKYQAWLTGR